MTGVTFFYKQLAQPWDLRLYSAAWFGTKRDLSTINVLETKIVWIILVTCCLQWVTGCV